MCIGRAKHKVKMIAKKCAIFTMNQKSINCYMETPIFLEW